MKVLLVEDSEEKAGQVEVVLRNATPDRGIEIERAKSFRGAIAKLEAETYDLLLLDLVMPTRDGEAPSDKAGRQVLSEVLDGSGCRPPSHIICLTAFEEIATALRDDAERNLVHVVIYDEISSKWRDALAAKARFVESRIRDAESRPKDFKTDLAIVTSTPQVELKEILNLTQPTPYACEYHQNDALHYYSASWKTNYETELSVVGCAAPSMGMTAACVTACKAIERWRPRFLVMTGIAAGTKKEEQYYGDIIVAEAAYDYGSGKIAEAEDGKRIFIPSHSQLRIDTELHALLQQWERTQSRTDDIRRAWHAERSRVPRLIVGLLASGAAVVQSQELVDEILSKSRKVVGLDMEAFAVFQAAHLATSPRPRVLVAKSVADFADKRKDDEWQHYASFTSARFVYEFFTNAKELQLGRPMSAT